jgi:hypothetical protein
MENLRCKQHTNLKKFKIRLVCCEVTCQSHKTKTSEGNYEESLQQEMVPTSSDYFFMFLTFLLAYNSRTVF